MKQYRSVVRILFAVVFIAGGVSHLFLGRLQPEGYVSFAHTALFSWLSDLWTSWVMPNIGWLTIVLGIYEIACGLSMLWRRTLLLGVCGMIVFLVFITVVGYGFPTGLRKSRVSPVQKVCGGC